MLQLFASLILNVYEPAQAFVSVPGAGTTTFPGDQVYVYGGVAPETIGANDPLQNPKQVGFVKLNAALIAVGANTLKSGDELNTPPFPLS